MRVSTLVPVAADRGRECCYMAVHLCHRAPGSEVIMGVRAQGVLGAEA